MLSNSYTFIIRKPLHGTFVYLRKDILKQCIEADMRVFVKIPQGKAEINPQHWMDNGTQRSQIFLRPGEPMELVGGYVPVRMPRNVVPPIPPLASVVETDPQMSLFDKPKRGKKKKPELPILFI